MFISPRRRDALCCSCRCAAARGWCAEWGARGSGGRGDGAAPALRGGSSARAASRTLAAAVEDVALIVGISSTSECSSVSSSRTRAASLCGDADALAAAAVGVRDAFVGDAASRGVA